MSFGNAVIFPFPAVQYIPMAITNVKQGKLENSGNPVLPAQILAGAELFKWWTLLKQKNELKLPEYLPEDIFPVLVINLQVDSVKYRGYFVTMTGRKNPGQYQLFTLTRRYFYKDKLCFELFDEHTGERLAKYSTIMSK